MAVDDGAGNVIVSELGQTLYRHLYHGGRGCEGLWTGRQLRAADPNQRVGGRGGNVHVADNGNHRIVVFSEAGEVMRTFSLEGICTGEMQNPMGVAVDGAGNVFVRCGLQQPQHLLVSGLLRPRPARTAGARAATARELP